LARRAKEAITMVENLAHSPALSTDQEDGPGATVLQTGCMFGQAGRYELLDDGCFLKLAGILNGSRKAGWRQAIWR